MKSDGLSFGEYVKQKRESLGKSLRGVAAELGISSAYLCDIEKGYRKPPQKRLEAFIEILGIKSEEEIDEFYDKAGISKQGQHTDINSYLENLPNARIALRTAKKNHFSNEDWIDVINIIKNKRE